jgi:hypothetical protein
VCSEQQPPTFKNIVRFQTVDALLGIIDIGQYSIGQSLSGCREPVDSLGIRWRRKEFVINGASLDWRWLYISPLRLERGKRRGFNDRFGLFTPDRRLGSRLSSVTFFATTAQYGSEK